MQNILKTLGKIVRNTKLFLREHWGKIAITLVIGFILVIVVGAAYLVKDDMEDTKLRAKSALAHFQTLAPGSKVEVLSQYWDRSAFEGYQLLVDGKASMGVCVVVRPSNEEVTGCAFTPFTPPQPKIAQ